MFGMLLAIAGPLAAQTGLKKAPELPADEVAPVETQCGQQALSNCTSQRVQELRRYREAMRRAATVTSTGTMSVDEARRVGNYDRWLTDIANSAEQISLRGDAVLQLHGAAARGPAIQFHQQYLAFMKRLRTESRLHDTSVGLMKRKHAVLVNMLGGAQ